MNHNFNTKLNGILAIFGIPCIIFLLQLIIKNHSDSNLIGNHLYTVAAITGPSGRGWYYHFYYEDKEYFGSIKRNTNRAYHIGSRYIVKFQKNNPENDVFMEMYPITDNSIKMGDTINRSLFQLD